jgi:hypothetical protein
MATVQIISLGFCNWMCEVWNGYQAAIANMAMMVTSDRPNALFVNIIKTASK